MMTTVTILMMLVCFRDSLQSYSVNVRAGTVSTPPCHAGNRHSIVGLDDTVLPPSNSLHLAAG